MDQFKEVLECCSLTDLGFEGDVFTWRNNNHNSEGYIRERLDRAVANVEWRTRFPGLRVINGDQRHSDHKPVVLMTESDGDDVQETSSTNRFRFEVVWVKEEMCEAIVENAWDLSMNIRGGLAENAVKDVAADLWDWNCNVLGDLEKRIRRVRRALEGCHKDQITARTVAREQVLKYRLEKLEDQKELYWKQ